MARFTLPRYDLTTLRNRQHRFDEASTDGDLVIGVVLNANDGFHSVPHLPRALPPRPRPSD
jgi:hypothetical protein